MISTRLISRERPTTTQSLLREVRAIADDLSATAIVRDGRANWLGRKLAFKASTAASEKPSIVAMEATVHNGVAGVALFLARAYDVLGVEEHASVARAAAKNAVHLAGSVEPRHRFGWGTGWTGIAWAAHEVGTITEDETLLAARDELLERMWASRRGDRLHDLNFGAGGAIPVLLRIHEDTGSARALELAQWHGKDLLRQAIVSGATRAWWPESRRGPYTPPLTGFTHGQAGIGWGLTYLYAHTRDERLREAAEGAFAYERAAFDKEQNDWRDLRNDFTPHKPVPRSISHVWCYGSAGHGIARTAAARHLRADPYVDEMSTAAENVKRSNDSMIFVPGRNTCLCHGVAGNADSLWLIEEALGRPQAAENARKAAAWLLARYGSEAGVSYPVGTNVGTWQGLMTGVSGVGTFLLRVATNGRSLTAMHPPAPQRTA